MFGQVLCLTHVGNDGALALLSAGRKRCRRTSFGSDHDEPYDSVRRFKIAEMPKGHGFQNCTSRPLGVDTVFLEAR